ncbi:hypothetical protein PR048_017651 [Dryococelus australis]|uniref:DUF4371 domain-containing protein n=1 Tax=Dryococelus australis TaxID=614101 RepID=A0ABQ9HA65_9NEOP|nr:hypothetical protein PR048_017651 [Dryococelus australis]
MLDSTLFWLMTSDVSQTEQFCLCVRYVDKDLFVAVNDVTGGGLATTIKDQLRSLWFNMNNMRGQGYDGAAAMKGVFRGCKAILQRDYPTGLYTHCSSHCLNLCLSDASKVQDVRNTFGTVSEICTFFGSSPKRTGILKKKLQEFSSSHTRLVKCCETQWVERHEGISIFSESLPQFVIALEELIESGDDEKVSYKLVRLRLFLVPHLSSFKISSVCLCVDFNVAIEHVDLTISWLTQIRDNAVAEFHKIFTECNKKAKSLGTEPRHLENFPADSHEHYYRRGIFIPYIEELISFLKEMFATHRKTIQCLQNILPSYAADKDFISVQPAFTFYQEDLKYPSQAILRAEWEKWVPK